MTNGTDAPRDVNIFFAGLFFFAFKSQSLDPLPPPSQETFVEGHVGIFHTDKNRHDLCLRLKDGEDFRDYKIYYDALGAVPREVLIEKRTGPSSLPSEARVLEGWMRPDESRLNDDPPCPFGWILDFESNDLHGPYSRVDRSQIFTVLRFKTGLFYTALIDKDEPFVAYQPPSLIKPIGHIAKVIGVKITLLEGEALVFSAGSLSWTLPNTISEVHFDHTCPGDPPASSPRPGSDNDMQEYYPLAGIPEGERFRFVPLLPAKPEGHGLENRFANPFICYGGGGSKGNGLI